jgi:hypothetical protein
MQHMGICFLFVREVVPWLRQLIACLSTWSTGVASVSVRVGFMLDEVVVTEREAFNRFLVFL